GAGGRAARVLARAQPARRARRLGRPARARARGVRRMTSAPLLERAIVPSIEPSPLSPREVLREFRKLTNDGAPVLCAGSARRRPQRLLSLGYVPRYKLELFGVTYYLCDARQNEDVRFFVAYLVHGGQVYARLLYKDGSLLWRCASHFAKSATENWIGKGDLKL